MAREFSLGMDRLTVGNSAVTLIFISPPAASTTALPNIQIMRMWASQAGTATSSQQSIQAETQVSAFPTLTSALPKHLKLGDSTASVLTGGTAGAAGTVGVNASAEGAGAKTPMFSDNFNILNGYLWVATPREIIDLGSFGVATIGGFGLFLEAAPGSLSNWSAGCNYAEGS